VCYLIQEFVGGEPASPDAFKSCQKKRQALRHWAEGLRDLHQVNIVHCDIKPQNAVIDRLTGEAKWIDLGWSRCLGLPHPSGGYVRVPVPPPAVPPETLAGSTIDYEKWDRPGDVFAFGAMIYYLLTGHWPQVPLRTLPSGHGIVKSTTLGDMLKEGPANRPDMIAVAAQL
jgi:serine/threonine protein kinase